MLNVKQSRGAVSQESEHPRNTISRALESVVTTRTPEQIVHEGC